MDSYADSIGKIKIDPERKNNPTLRVTPAELRELQRVNGACNWLARNLRLDISFQVSKSQQSQNEATVGTLIEANFMIHHCRARKHEMKIRAVPLQDLEKLVVVVASDASPGCMPRQGSQGGMVIMLADKAVLSGEADVTILYHASHRIKRGTM
jgi:hypothetical protein